MVEAHDSIRDVEPDEARILEFTIHPASQLRCRYTPEWLERLHHGIKLV